MIFPYDDVIMGTMVSQITSLTIVYSTVYSDTDQRKHQSSASLAIVRGIHRGPMNSPHKWPVTRKMFPFDDVIIFLWRHHVFGIMNITPNAPYSVHLAEYTPRSLQWFIIRMIMSSRKNVGRPILTLAFCVAGAVYYWWQGTLPFSNELIYCSTQHDHERCTFVPWNSLMTRASLKMQTSHLPTQLQWPFPANELPGLSSE